jgi:hypothetical protein
VAEVAVRAVYTGTECTGIELIAAPRDITISAALLDQAEGRFLSVADGILTIRHTKGSVRYQLGAFDNSHGATLRQATRIDD